MWDGGWGELRKYELYEAVSKNNLPRMNELITTRGVDTTFCNPQEDGKTILHKASENGHVESVAYILRLPASKILLSTRDNFGKLPIDYAIQKNHPQIIEILQNPEDDSAAILLFGSMKMT